MDEEGQSLARLRRREAASSEVWASEPEALQNQDRTNPEFHVFTGDPLAHVDDDKTPVAEKPEKMEQEAREREVQLALELTRYFARLPEDMSLPASRFLANSSPEEIAAYEEMYRHLDTELKDILRKYATVYTPPLPSFDDFLSLDIYQVRQHTAALRWAVTRYSPLLPKHLYREVFGNLTLYAAFAENIANAKYIQQHGSSAA